MVARGWVDAQHLFLSLWCCTVPRYLSLSGQPCNPGAVGNSPPIDPWSSRSAICGLLPNRRPLPLTTTPYLETLRRRKGSICHCHHHGRRIESVQSHVSILPTSLSSPFAPVCFVTSWFLVRVPRRRRRCCCRRRKWSGCLSPTGSTPERKYHKPTSPLHGIG